MATATPGGIASSIEAHATKLDAANTILAGTQAANKRSRDVAPARSRAEFPVEPERRYCAMKCAMGGRPQVSGPI